MQQFASAISRTVFNVLAPHRSFSIQVAASSARAHNLISSRASLSSHQSKHRFDYLSKRSSMHTDIPILSNIRRMSSRTESHSSSAESWQPRNAEASIKLPQLDSPSLNSKPPIPAAESQSDNLYTSASYTSPIEMADSDTSSSFEAELADVIETKVAPAIRADGGDISYIGYVKDKRICQVQLSGACLSCSKSTITLRFMVERVLKHYFPDEIVKVVNVDVEDGCDS